MTRLYLIRHARQNSSLCNVNVELAPEGRLQAELLRDRLCSHNIDAIYSSDLFRAKQTAEIINQALGLPILIREELREISFGLMEGQTNQYIEEHFHDFKLEQARMLEDIPYPGGENGASVSKRAMPVIREIMQCKRESIVVVTHGGVIRVLLAALFGRNQAERFLFAQALENTSITELLYNQDSNRFYLQRFNDHAHLEGHPELFRENW